ncbi:MAG: multiple sugar transport system permease protein [Streptosporangiaceae bacterium]|jgi:multiple sugar transport system permease protein|nr:multiple sugar transport system permease protein [Streptosporangiaceae bacterium]
MPDVAAAEETAGDQQDRAASPRRPQRAGRARRSRRRLEPLAWLAPAAALIALVVLWPIVALVQTSMQNITPIGVTIGSAGAKNFSAILHDPNVPGILVRTVLWVAAVVGITMLMSLGLAQLFNQRFPGRRIVRWALIAPWAASVMMTALIFRWMLQPDNGAINIFLHQLGVVGQFNSNESSWLGRPDSAMAWMIGVAVFVSLPFTTYTLLAGLQTIPSDLFEAAMIDGASKWRSYRRITLPLLRPAFVVAAVINIMNVFNSFPIIWEMTRGGPGYETNTTTVYMYNLKESFIGKAAAMSIVNFSLIIVIILIYLRVNNWNRQEAR